MDLREKKTIRNISNAFLELRAKKPLEKITVKELSEAAEISKATFYLHYKDIYDLSDQLQQDALHRMISDIDDPIIFITDPVTAHKNLQMAFESYKTLLSTLFSGSQEAMLSLSLERAIKTAIFNKRPELKKDIDTNVKLSFLLMGVFHSYIQNSRSFESEDVSSSLKKILEEFCK